METVFRKSRARPLPASVRLLKKSRKLTGPDRAANPNRREVAERFKLWTDKRGKLRTAPITTGADGSPRLLIESGNARRQVPRSRDVRKTRKDGRREYAIRLGRVLRIQQWQQ